MRGSAMPDKASEFIGPTRVSGVDWPLGFHWNRDVIGSRLGSATMDTLCVAFLGDLPG